VLRQRLGKAAALDENQHVGIVVANESEVRERAVSKDGNTS
jgi:hypothetical protein